MQLGSAGTNVLRWQEFLVGQGYYWLVVSGTFDQETKVVTEMFQKEHKLTIDGKVGPKTQAKAKQLGFPTEATPFPRPSWTPMTYQERARFFPSFSYKPAPVAGNPEAIAVDPTWIQKNIVTVPLPQLVGVPGAPRDGRILMHRLAATPMRQLWEAWEQAGLLHLVLSFEGAWVPRFVRGSRTTLSNHALGTAFDINARWNALGVTPAAAGTRGSVVDLLPLAYEHGFAWGGHFGGRGRRNAF